MKHLDFDQALTIAALQVRANCVGFGLRTEFGSIGIEVLNITGDPDNSHTIRPWKSGPKSSRFWVDNLDANYDYYATIDWHVPLNGLKPKLIRALEFNFARLLCHLEYLHYGGTGELETEQLDVLAATRLGHHLSYSSEVRGIFETLYAREQKGLLLSARARDEQKTLVQRLAARREKDMRRARVDANTTWISNCPGINDYNVLLLTLIHRVKVTREMLQLADCRSTETLFATFAGAKNGNSQIPNQTIKQYLCSAGDKEIPMPLNTDRLLEKTWDMDPKMYISSIRTASKRLDKLAEMIIREYQLNDDGSEKKDN